MIHDTALPVTSKRCLGCERDLPATPEFFHANKTRPSGLQSLCRECRAARDVRHRQGMAPIPKKTGERSCFQCGSAFVVTLGSKRLYCSESCGREHIRAHSPTETRICGFCGDEFSMSLATSSKARRYCSVRCRSDYHRDHGRNKEMYLLAQDGKSLEEIAAIFNVPVKRAANAMHRFKHRRGHSLSASSIRRRWVKGKSCLICGFDRYIEAAHIIPAKAGGPMDDDNLMPLCPNHHRLFDRKALLLEEAIQIRDRVPNYLEFVITENQ